MGELNVTIRILRFASNIKCFGNFYNIVHSENFFQENHKKLEGLDGNFQILKRLIALTTCDDDDVAAIACYDIGEFVRCYPNGRLIAKQLGAKDAVMNLINHDNLELQRHALQCVSKIMVQNWSVCVSN